METYTLVGTEATWIFAFVPIPAILLHSHKRWKAGLSPILTPWQGAFAAYFFILSALGIPCEWVLGGASFLFGGWCLISKQISNVYGGRILCGLVSMASGAFFVGLRGRGDQIILSDEQVAFTFYGRTDTVPRRGLSVHRMPRHQWLYFRPSSSWFSSLGNTSGPSASGFDVYWGPHGLIRGDDLGQHVAKWAGTVPNIP